MQKPELNQQKYVYGLDIGTRSIVGTVGYLEKDRFIVVAQHSKEHETRAMIDGQIHDIGAVGDRIREVTEELEYDLKTELKQVCIAAAGRVLRTVTTHVETDLEGEKIITKEDIFALDSYGVEKAYEQFSQNNDLDMKFYCVGYTVMRYYMNNYPISNLENHKAKNIAADLIATFLPDDVVDGLYKAVELAGLEVANLTLEPIAAMEVAIPQMYRMLNIALIDVGAGTSDISITKDGSIVAYGMLPVAGDSLTEDIAMHCLVDFTTAESIKRGIETQETVEYKDIMGLPQTISREEVLNVVAEHLSSMADQAADKIMELNGEKPVSAVFVVGGGGKIKGYTDIVAKRLGIAPERCALRGEEVMQKIDFIPDNIIKDSLLVTPIGICLNYYEQSNNFMFVTFNGDRIKLYDNNKLAIVDAAISAEFPNEDLFPKRGDPLTFLFNGKQRVIRGDRGESAQILLNGEQADIHTPIRANDIITVERSTAGNRAQIQLGKFPEYKESIRISVNGKNLTLPKFASVNGELQSASYEIVENDAIEMLDYYTVEQISEVMDVALTGQYELKVNHETADLHTKVYDNFALEWQIVKNKQSKVNLKEELNKEDTTENNTEDTAEDSTKDITEDATDYAKEDSVEDTAKETSKNTKADSVSTGMSALERARESAKRIAEAPISKEVEEELKKAQAYAAAERISSFATAYNQSGQMPPEPKKRSTSTKPQTNHVQTSAHSNASEQKNEPKEKTNTQAQHKSDMEQSQQAPQQTVQQTIQKKNTETSLPSDAIRITVNGQELILSGKKDYIYVDVFDHIDFDLTKPQGKTVETLINGRQAQYVEPLKTGDVLDIFWKD